MYVKSIFCIINMSEGNYPAYFLMHCSYCCRLSGLIVDVFGEIGVVASSAAWVEKYKPEIESCISRIDGINHIKWRPSVDILKEEGMDTSHFKDSHPSTCPERTKVRNSSEIACHKEILSA